MKLSKQKNSTHGFTVIEVMIVMVVAAMILLIVFLAVPTLQRHSRNHQRDADAALLAQAIDQCLVQNNNLPQDCDNPAEIPLPKSELSIYTGYHYGSTCGVYCSGTPVPPTDLEMNWLYGLYCNKTTASTQGYNFSISANAHMFIVTYVKEADGGGTYNWCLDG